MGDTNIEWTDRVWNPIRGCSRVSAGCARCYAEVMAARFARQWGTPEIVRPDGGWSGVLSFVESKLTEPLHWRDPQKVFVNSMSDLFHERVPDEWIDRVFAVMALSPQHTFQVLTKRPGRMRAYLSDTRRSIPVYNAATVIARGDFSKFPGDMAQTRSSGGSWWPLPNVWLGVSVEDQATADARIPLLLKTRAAVRFVSYEPALGPVDFTNIDGIDRCGSNVPSIDALTGCWAVSRERPPQEPRLHQVIVGGESGPGARPCDVEWIRSVRDQCRGAGVACFVKQVGAEPRETGGDHLYDWPDYDLPEHWASRAGTSPAGGQWWAIPLRDRKGGDMEEWPEDLRVRQFPAVRP